MATVTRTTTWVNGDTLTASALNAEFNNLLNSIAISNADLSGSISPSKISGTAVTLAGSESLSNKTIVFPIIATISNSGTITIPTGTDTLVGRATTDTLTNKRVTPRVTSTTSSTTPAPNADTDDVYIITALGGDTTFSAPTGTPTQGQILLIRIKDNGSQRNIAWNAIYRAGTSYSLPLLTSTSKTMYIKFVYNSTDTKWDLVNVANGI